VTLESSAGNSTVCFPVILSFDKLGHSSSSGFAKGISGLARVSVDCLSATRVFRDVSAAPSTESVDGKLEVVATGDSPRLSCDQYAVAPGMSRICYVGTSIWSAKAFKLLEYSKGLTHKARSAASRS
jgi:hypothetical protein